MSLHQIAFAVIGCGRMGLRRMQTIAAHPTAKLVCVADVNPMHAQSAASRYGVPYYSDYQEVASREDVDCALVCVPNRFHQEVVTALLASQKRVWCEKPLSATPESALAMVEAAIQHRKCLKTGSNLRYFPNVLKARELLDKGAIGEPVFARGWIGHEGWNLHDSWYADPEIIGGGTLLDNGSHLLDLIRWFLGEIVECTGLVASRLWKVQSLEDNALALLRTRSGVPVFVHSSWTEWRGYMYLEISGSDGGIEIDSRLPVCRTVHFRRDKKEPRLYDYSEVPPSSYAYELDAYIMALSTDQEPLPSGYDGLRAVQLTWAIYESARRACTLQTFLPEDEVLYHRYLKKDTR